MIVAGGERIFVYSHYYYYYLSFSEPKNSAQSALYEPMIFRKQIHILLASFLPSIVPITRDTWMIAI